MTHSKVGLLALMLASAAIPGIAMAQAASTGGDGADQDADKASEIVVHGFTESLEKARQIKRDSTIIKDVIVAQDMAKFPELNLAESIQRLPGVAINREAGEGRRITLRGLGPDYTRVQLNGMEVLGNTDSAMDSRGQRSRDRAFDFNIFASELFSRVEVDKTYQAAQIEGGMAGTIGLFTGKPFAYHTGLKGAASAKIGTNSYTHDPQMRFAGMLSQNWDNRFGITVSVAYSKRKTQEQGNDTYSSKQLSAGTIQNYLDKGLDISALSAAQQAKFTSGDLVFATGNRLSVWDARQERLGITAAMQWQPADNLLLTLDGLHGQFTTHRDEYHLATRPSGASVAFDTNSTINALHWDDSNYVDSIDVSDATFASEHRRELNKNRFDQVALTGKWDVTERFGLDGLVGYEKSKYTTPYDDKLYLSAKGGLSTRFSADGTAMANTYDWDTASLANYRFTEMYFREFWNQTNLWQGNLKAHFDINDALKLQFGGDLRRYNTSGSEVYNDGQAHAHTGDGVEDYASVYTGYNGDSWVIGNFEQAFSHYGLAHTVAGATDIENTFNVTETTKTGFGQLDWNTGIGGGMRLRGNLGGRAYFTHVKGVGNIIDKNWTPIGQNTASSSYSGFLPAFNATLDVTPSFLVRVAVARNINRPALTSMAPMASVKLSDSGYTVSVGNPDLKPYRDTALDFSAEWYFGKLGMVTLGVFRKNITDLIYTRTEYNVPYSATGLSNGLYTGLTGSTVISEYSRPVNLSDAHVTGVEMAAQSTFAFLPAPFDKLGVIGNLTFLKSQAMDGSVKGKIPGMSNTNANLTLYYETKRWGLRGSVNYRSSYLRSIYDGIDPTSEDGFDGTVYMDAAAFVTLAHGIKLTVDAINLTNETEVQYNSIYHRLHNETQSGRTIYAGVSFDF